MRSWGLRCSLVAGAHCTPQPPVQHLVCVLRILHAWGQLASTAMHRDMCTLVAPANVICATLHAVMAAQAVVLQMRSFRVIIACA